jgi:hypothetical protein
MQAKQTDGPTTDEAWAPNLSWITPELAVGGSFPIARAEHLAGTLGIRAVVDLRSEASDDPVALQRHGLAFLHLPTDDLQAVAVPMLETGVGFVVAHLRQGHRVLVHCEHGIGRSATLALCVLVAQGMTPLEAVEVGKSRRAVLSPSPVQFECWAEWLRIRRRDHGAEWEVPDFSDFAAIAYRHLTTG